jgi:hypothetical protein
MSVAPRQRLKDAELAEPVEQLDVVDQLHWEL